MNRVGVTARDVASVYLTIKKDLEARGFADELDHDWDLDPTSMTEQSFLREASWVILSSGMRESVIRQRFTFISKAFYWWTSSQRILKNQNQCRRCAITTFRHERKIDAIVAVASFVARHGIEYIKASLVERGPESLLSLPYFGPITSIHLLKNLGFPYAKPDRHLVRIAQVMKYSSPQQLCEDIATLTGHPIAAIDLVWWRFATQYHDYQNQIYSLLCAEQVVAPMKTLGSSHAGQSVWCT